MTIGHQYRHTNGTLGTVAWFDDLSVGVDCGSFCWVGFVAAFGKQWTLVEGSE